MRIRFFQDLTNLYNMMAGATKATLELIGSSITLSCPAGNIIRYLVWQCIRFRKTI